MATAGQTISKENFSTGWAQEWSDKHGNKDQTRYVYICAPCWYMVVDATYAAFGGSGIVQVYASYYTGTGWSDEAHVEISATGGNVTKRYAHNRDEGNINGGELHSNYPLWRIRYWPSRNNNRWQIKLYAGSWGVARKTSDGSYINYPQGQKIYSIGRTGASTNIHASGTTNDDSNVLNNVFNSDRRKGSPVLASSDHELVWYPYKN